LPLAKQGTARVAIINPGMGYYAQDLAQNDPFLRDPVIRMITHGRKNDEAMMARYFPDLALLSRNYKGAVYGYPAVAASSSADVGVAGEQQR